MEIFLNDGEIHLTENSPLRLRNAAGQGITCTSGTIWITVTGNARDIFLAPGESYRVQGNGLALVEAIGAGSIQIFRKETSPPCACGSDVCASFSAGVKSRCSRPRARKMLIDSRHGTG